MWTPGSVLSHVLIPDYEHHDTQLICEGNVYQEVECCMFGHLDWVRTWFRIRVWKQVLRRDMTMNLSKRSIGVREMGEG